MDKRLLGIIEGRERDGGNGRRTGRDGQINGWMDESRHRAWYLNKGAIEPRSRHLPSIPLHHSIPVSDSF